MTNSPQKSRPIDCIIYDLDGVLLDTEPVYTAVTQGIVARWGKTFDWDIKRHMIGRRSIDSARFLVDALQLPISAQEYLELRRDGLERGFSAVPALPGAERFVRRAKERGLIQAIATSSERPQFELKASSHADWFGLFAATVTGDDARIGQGKPAPDIFLIAAAEVGVAPDRCLVVEDSPAGVTAGKAAGMRVVALPDPAMDRSRYRDADLIADGFDGIPLDEFL